MRPTYYHNFGSNALEFNVRVKIGNKGQGNNKTNTSKPQGEAKSGIIINMWLSSLADDIGEKERERVKIKTNKKLGNLEINGGGVVVVVVACIWLCSNNAIASITIRNYPINFFFLLKNPFLCVTKKL